MNYFAVSPEHQRKRLGQQLMAEVEVRLKAIGCPKINLQVRAENHSAMAFYRAYGFDEEARVNFGKRLIPDAES